MRGSGRSCASGGAVAGAREARRSGGRGDLELGPDQDADHVAHEGVGGDRKPRMSPLAVQLAASTSRSKRTWSVWVGVKAVKSWVPDEGRRRRRRAPRGRRGAGHQRARPRSKGLGRARGRQAVAVAARALASRAGVEAVGDAPSRRATATSLGRDAVRARRARSGGSSAAVAKLATWPRAWTPVSVRPATVSGTWLAQDLLERRLELALHASAAPAGAPSRGSRAPSYSMSRRHRASPQGSIRSPSATPRIDRRARPAHQRRRDLGPRPAGGCAAPCASSTASRST